MKAESQRVREVDLYTLLQRQGLGSHAATEIWGNLESKFATFLHGNSPGRLQGPRWAMSEQDFLQDRPQETWLRILCSVLLRNFTMGHK